MRKPATIAIANSQTGRTGAGGVSAVVRQIRVVLRQRREQVQPLPQHAPSRRRPRRRQRRCLSIPVPSKAQRQDR